MAVTRARAAPSVRDARFARRQIAVVAAVERELADESHRGLGRIAFEQGRATAACELVVGAATADVYGPAAGELAEGSGGRRQRRGGGGGGAHGGPARAAPPGFPPP